MLLKMANSDGHRYWRNKTLKPRSPADVLLSLKPWTINHHQHHSRSTNSQQHFVSTALHTQTMSVFSVL